VILSRCPVIERRRGACFRPALFSQWTWSISLGWLNPRGQTDSAALRTHAKWAKVEAFCLLCCALLVSLDRGGGAEGIARLGWSSDSDSDSESGSGVLWFPIITAVLKFKFRTIIVRGDGVPRGGLKLFTLRANLIPFPHVRA